MRFYPLFLYSPLREKIECSSHTNISIKFLFFFFSFSLCEKHSPPVWLRRKIHPLPTGYPRSGQFPGHRRRCYSE